MEAVAVCAGSSVAAAGSASGSAASVVAVAAAGSASGFAASVVAAAAAGSALGSAASAAVAAVAAVSAASVVVTAVAAASSSAVTTVSAGTPACAAVSSGRISSAAEVSASADSSAAVSENSPSALLTMISYLNSVGTWLASLEMLSVIRPVPSDFAVIMPSSSISMISGVSLLQTERAGNPSPCSITAVSCRVSPTVTLYCPASAV